MRSHNKKQNYINSKVKDTEESSGVKKLDNFFAQPLDITSSTTVLHINEDNNNANTINMNAINNITMTDILNTPSDSSLYINNIYNNANTNANVNTNVNIAPLKIECPKIFTNIEIKNKIDQLSEDELQEIFKIVKNNNEKFTINKNGIFINLNSLKKLTIQDLSNFLYFCENNNKMFCAEEKNREQYKLAMLE